MTLRLCSYQQHELSENGLTKAAESPSLERADRRGTEDGRAGGGGARENQVELALD